MNQHQKDTVNKEQDHNQFATSYIHIVLKISANLSQHSKYHKQGEQSKHGVFNENQ